MKVTKYGQWTSVTIRFTNWKLSDTQIEALLNDHMSGPMVITSIAKDDAGVEFSFAVDGQLSMASEIVGQWKLPADRAKIVKMEFIDGAELERENARTPERLIGTAEVAELLGVTRQRVSQILRDIEGAPEPIERLAAGPVWSESSWNHFAENWARKGGRPPKVV